MNLNVLYPKYTDLRKTNPEFARRCIIKAHERLKNISVVARHFQTTRKTVRKILQRYETLKEEGIEDLSKRPKNSPNKTPPHIELMIIAERRKTGYGRERIVRLLKERGIDGKPSTVRYVLKRYKVSSKYKRSRYRKRNRFYDFEELYPLSHFEVNLKEIYDKGTLSEECIDYARGLNIPPYQWTALDVKTMLRFMSYSDLSKISFR